MAERTAAAAVYLAGYTAAGATHSEPGLSTDTSAETPVHEEGADES